MNRREFIKTSGIRAVTAWAGASVLLTACHTEEDMIGKPNWIVEGSFDRALPIPPVVNGGASLQAGFSTREIVKGRLSSTLSYSDGILGPTIRASTGDTVGVVLQNNLNEETNIHWHGLILPENMDGHPRDVAASGNSIQYSLPVIQRAGTYWYHPHPHGATARQVFKGLAGMFIVNDAEENALNLPSGEFEIPLIIQDKRMEGSELVYAPSEEEVMTGYLGEEITVNGIQSPFASVGPSWYRLRVLNGSTARVYDLALTEGLPLHIIGADGGLLVAPEKVSSILIGPGERLDLLVDFSNIPAGREIYLQSNKFSEFNVQGRQSYRIMKFRVERAETFPFTLPTILSQITPITHSAETPVRSFEISSTTGGGHGSGAHAINGKVFDMHEVETTVQQGSTEIWEFDNANGDEIHPMHIHGVQFQVLERHGGRNRLLPSEKGWKDTVLVMAGEKVRVIMRFPSYTGVFVFHCHNLEHEDDGMMQNYRIV